MPLFLLNFTMSSVLAAFFLIGFVLLGFESAIESTIAQTTKDRVVRSYSIVSFVFICDFF